MDTSSCIKIQHDCLIHQLQVEELSAYEFKNSTTVRRVLHFAPPPPVPGHVS